MEVVKNFFVGIIVTLAALVVLGACFLLWPIFVGIGSFLFFVAAIVLTVIAGFYIVVLIGYVVRKGLKK